MKELQNPFEVINSELSDIHTLLREIKQDIDTQKPVKNTPEVLLSTKEVCDLLKITRVTLWSWENKQKIIRSIRIGNAKRYRLKDIESLIAKR